VLVGLAELLADALGLVDDDVTVGDIVGFAVFV
jgi:hypothetical protein